MQLVVGQACPPQAMTLADAWRAACRRIDRLDARLLIEQVMACNHADLIAHPTRLVDAHQQEQLAALVERRAGGEPLAYILGSCEFYGREFVVSPAVLIPRPETELLIDLAIERLPRGSARILDLGTGSGVLAVTLARLFPAASVTAVELSPEALAIARGNAARQRVDVVFHCGCWYEPLGGERFDLVVANPPYVAHADPHLMCDGLPFEPRMALTDDVLGGNGLGCIAAVIDGAIAHLRPGGRLLVEHGYDQAAAVRDLMERRGLSEITSWQDLSGIERASGAVRGRSAASIDVACCQSVD